MPLEMPSATRELLQTEMARIYGQESPSAVPERMGRIAWWPRLAWAGGIFASLVLVTVLLLQPAVHNPQPLQLAQKAPMAPSEPAVPPPAARPGSAETLAQKPAPEPPRANEKLNEPAKAAPVETSEPQVESKQKAAASYGRQFSLRDAKDSPSGLSPAVPAPTTATVAGGIAGNDKVEAASSVKPALNAEAPIAAPQPPDVAQAAVRGLGRGGGVAPSSSGGRQVAQSFGTRYGAPAGAARQPQTELNLATEKPEAAASTARGATPPVGTTGPLQQVVADGSPSITPAPASMASPSLADRTALASAAPPLRPASDGSTTSVGLVAAESERLGTTSQNTHFSYQATDGVPASRPEQVVAARRAAATGNVNGLAALTAVSYTTHRWQFTQGSANRLRLLEELQNAPTGSASLNLRPGPQPTQAAFSPVLTSFELERKGNQIQIRDQDGSTYTGQIIASESLARTALRAPLTGRLQAPAVASREKPARPEAPSAAPGVGGQPDEGFFFRAAGTNTSLRQSVQINGRLIIPQVRNAATNSASFRQLIQPAQPPASPAPTTPSNSRLAYGSGVSRGRSPTVSPDAVPTVRLQAQAIIGNTNRVEINAVQATP